MNILLLGSGGREHAIAWKLQQSGRCQNLYIAPGNAGTTAHGTNLDIGVNDFESIAEACTQYEINMLVVGPEEPLVKGIRDFFEAREALKKILIIGPGKAGAQLEGSKDFSKAFMKKYAIPTAAYASFTSENYEEGTAYLQQHTLPIVLKADGLAAGKGVLICQTHEEALAEFEAMIRSEKFGAASAKVVVEEFLTGIEMSVFVLTDGEHFVLLPEAKDYKKIGEGETGLNTGGMGAISPVPFFDETLRHKITTEIVAPTVEGLQQENIPYCGIIFIGLIVEDGAAKVIEYNCRLGDPETEVVIPRLQNDLVTLLEATAKKELHTQEIMANPLAAVGIVAVSEGYPGDYRKNIPIEGLADENDGLLFHAGTSLKEDKIVTNGGRVLVAVSMAENLQEAIQQSKQKLSEISFEGMYYRKDIGFEFS